MQTFRNVLFVPHGAPTFALNPGAVGAAMSDMVQKLSTPRAIVVVSPHPHRQRGHAVGNHPRLCWFS